MGVGCIAADPRQQQFQIESIFEEEGVVKEAEQVNWATQELWLTVLIKNYIRAEDGRQG